ncbi:MAG: S9 family peptidase [Pseudomonadota bacterium]
MKHAFFALLLALFSTPALAERPIEQFAAAPLIADPVMSPSGTKMAMTININGTQTLVIRTILGAQTAPTLINTNGNELQWVRWVNDDWLIIGVGHKETGGSYDRYVRAVVAISADGRQNRTLGENTNVIWTDHSGSARILLSFANNRFTNNFNGGVTAAQVDEIDLATGHRHMVAAPIRGIWSWYADAAGNVRAGVGLRGEHLIMVYRINNDATFRTVERVNARAREDVIVPLIFSPDGTNAIVTSNPDGYDAVYNFDLTTFELGTKIFGVPGYDVDFITASADHRSLAGVGYTDQRFHMNWLDPHLAGIQTALDASVPGRSATLVSMNADRTKFIVHVGSASNPGAYYYMDSATDGVLRMLGRSNEALGRAALSTVRTIHYRARDGVEIEAVLTLPQGRAETNLPLIMLPHGGPFARDSESWDWWAQFLADRGYAVLQPNYRGSSGYGLAFSRRSEGQWGLAMQDDLDDGVAWAVSQGIADRGRVCIAGASYGGYAAMRAAQRGGGIYRCAISYAGVSDLAAMLRYDSNFLYDVYMALQREEMPNVGDVSPIRHAETFSMPILLMHGAKDLRVPVDQSRSMASALRGAGRQVRYVEQREGDHHFTRQEDRLQFLSEMENFLDAHNPADPVPAATPATP